MAEETGISDEEFFPAGKQEVYRLEPGEHFRDQGKWHTVKDIEAKAECILITTTEDRVFRCTNYHVVRPLRKRRPKKPTINKEKA